jgi:predicted transcriptional regulator
VAYKLFNEDTGEILEVRRKKTKRTESFFMMNLKDAAAIAKTDNLHGTEYKVLFFLLSRIDYENRAVLTQSFIAKELGMPQPQVSAAIKKLVEAGVISKISVGGANGYMVSEFVASRGSLTK